MSNKLRKSQYLGVHWSIFSDTECQRLVALAPELSELSDRQLSLMGTPAFAREFWSYGYGVLSEDFFDIQKIEFIATKCLDRIEVFSQINQELPLPKIKLEDQSLEEIYNKLNSSFNICMIPFQLFSGEIRFWNYGIYAGPPSRFCKENLSQNQYYPSDSGNMEVDRFIKAIGGNGTSLVKKEPVIFNSHNRAVLKNRQFCHVYSAYLDKDNADLRSISVGDSSDLEEFSSISIKLEEVPQTLLNDDWWERQDFNILLFEYFGGIFYFMRSDKKSILVDIMKIKENPYKVIDRLVLRVPCYNFEKLLGGKLFLGVEAE